MDLEKMYIEDIVYKIYCSLLQLVCFMEVGRGSQTGFSLMRQ